MGKFVRSFTEDRKMVRRHALTDDHWELIEDLFGEAAETGIGSCTPPRTAWTGEPTPRTFGESYHLDTAGGVKNTTGWAMMLPFLEHSAIHDNYNFNLCASESSPYGIPLVGDPTWLI